MDDRYEVILILILIITYLYTIDASGYRLGVYNCNSKAFYGRQLSVKEARTFDISELEAMGLEYCVQNIDTMDKPRIIR